MQHVLYWDPTNGAWDLHPLVTLGGTSSRAAAINNSGQIAGWATDEDRQWQGFVCDLYTGDVKHIGGVTDSLVTAVNNQGLAVGRYRATLSTLSYRALAWDFATDTIVDLNELTGDDDWTLFECWGVNDAGQIAGFGAHSIEDIYYQRGYLLTPKPIQTSGSFAPVSLVAWGKKLPFGAAWIRAEPVVRCRRSVRERNGIW